MENALPFLLIFTLVAGTVLFYAYKKNNRRKQVINNFLNTYKGEIIKDEVLLKKSLDKFILFRQGTIAKILHGYNFNDIHHHCSLIVARWYVSKNPFNCNSTEVEAQESIVAIVVNSKVKLPHFVLRKTGSTDEKYNVKRLEYLVGTCSQYKGTILQDRDWHFHAIDDICQLSLESIETILLPFEKNLKPFWLEAYGSTVMITVEFDRSVECIQNLLAAIKNIETAFIHNKKGRLVCDCLVTGGVSEEKKNKFVSLTQSNLRNYEEFIV
jgi:hypothetical protein